MGSLASLASFGAEVSRRLAAFVPHDGYLLRGLDPITGAGCLAVAEGSYSPAAYRRLELNELGGRDLHSLPSLLRGRSPVGVLGGGTGGPAERHSERLHDIMKDEGLGAEMRIALRHGGVVWGAVALLRAYGQRPFTATEVEHASRLAGPLAVALRGFVAGRGLRPGPEPLAPGLVLVDDDDTVTAASATARDWLRRLVPDPETADDVALFGNVWNIALLARHTRAAAVSRIPTGGGWLTIRGEPLDGAVAVTLHRATASEALPALAAWFGLTPSEEGVIRGALRGLAAKQIASRLHVSPHTVHDHFKAVYRKTGVRGRDELVAALTA